FDFDATGIGSVPFTDAEEACSLIFENFKTIPFWPQLPKRSFLESMYAQYSERLPGAVIDEVGKSIHIETAGVAESVEELYGNYLDGNVDFFAISEKFALGFYKFLEHLQKARPSLKFVKGQTTGPISYALSVTDENRKAIIHDKDLFEIVTKMLCMRARWQIRKLKKLFPAVIIFIDEPYLVSIGSSFVNINVEEAFSRLDELIIAIKEEGALAGLHCCGNTDWSVLLKRNLDILNFDSYAFMKEFLLYSAEIKTFLQKGSTIAWGIVPSSEEVDKHSGKTLAEKLRDELQALVDKGIPADSISSIVTPSCGVGTLDENRARKVFELTRIVSSAMRT
ncbi:MAG: hypothetical protein NC933_01775, partial [Candidatus Omnitrophica bacterium]|nr:hypothetical protein [Candidatus Omnitrophota bacterium]